MVIKVTPIILIPQITLTPLAHVTMAMLPKSVPYPVPPMSFSPHNLPGANCSGAVIMNNVQVSGNLNITNGKQASGNADDQPSLPAAANATSSIQPSIFATSELRETPSCTEQPEAKPGMASINFFLSVTMY